MALGPQLVLKQQHRLIITPALRQSLFLLQVPTLELQGLVQQELMENPFLQEQEDGEGGQEDGAEREGEDESPAVVDQTKELTPEQPPPEEGFSLKEWEDYFASESSDLGYLKESNPDEDKSFEQAGNRTESLADHMVEQLQLADVDEPVQEAAKLIIGNLDHHGYLRVTLEELEQSEKVSRDLLEQALTLVQTFDPSGVGARNLQECLLIQLRERGLSSSVAARVVREHWTDFEHKRWHVVAKALGVSHEEMQKTIEIISQLNPKPGRNFSQDPPQYVIPHVVRLRG